MRAAFRLRCAWVAVVLLVGLAGCSSGERAHDFESAHDTDLRDVRPTGDSRDVYLDTARWSAADAYESPDSDRLERRSLWRLHEASDPGEELSWRVTLSEEFAGGVAPREGDLIELPLPNGEARLGVVVHSKFHSAGAVGWAAQLDDVDYGERLIAAWVDGS